MLDNAHIETSLATDDDLESKLHTDEKRRRKALRTIEVALYRAATNLGQTPEQARAKVELLFRTFVSETFLFVLLGTDDLKDAIAADGTIAWLDTVVGQKTIRLHLTDRL